MKKFGTLLMILMFVLFPAVLFAQDAMEPAPEEPAAEEPAAEEPAPAEEPAAEEPAPGELGAGETAEEPAPAEEPAAEEPAPAEEPTAEEPAATEPALQEPAGTLGAGGEAKVAPPYVNLMFLAGQPIVDNAGTELGTLQDAFLTSDGMVSHVVANVRNAPGVQQGTYVFPISYIQADQGRMVLNLPASPQFQQLQGAKNAGIVAMDSIQASSLLQFNLLNDQGQNIGTIQDIVLNLQSGEVSYVAINFSSLLGAGEKVFAVPYSEIWYNLNDRTVTIYNINASALEQKTGISSDNWPETADPNWNTVQ